MPQNIFFLLWTHNLLVNKKMIQRLFFSTLHPLSSVIFATATVVAFVLLRNSWLDFHCYTQPEAMPTQKSAQKWHCDLSRLLAQKITNGIHSCKPASPNRPIHYNSDIVRDKKNFSWKLCDNGKTCNGWRGKYLVFRWFSWKFSNEGLDFLTYHRLVSSVMTYRYRGAGWGVREAGWKHEWRVTSQRLL